ncbi:AAA family ATPase [Dactylosporangium sp. CA-139066]|uniref:AAA family ATPase n=1 Tax=Dactylosporangium sp. CA-139066 TaxID=3239930 RepID=UPI003D944EAC
MAAVDAPRPWPAFAREIEGTLSVHAQYVVYGNIRDKFVLPGPDQRDPVRLESLPQLLWERLAAHGYPELITFDQVHGFSRFSGGRDPGQRAWLGRSLASLGHLPTLRDLRDSLARVTGAPPPLRAESAKPPEPAAREARAPRAALVVDYASRIAHRQNELDASERDFFLYCLKMAETAGQRIGDLPEHTEALFNPVIWLVEHERDLPSWFTAGSERIRTVAVPEPGLDDRTAIARYLAARMFDIARYTDPDKEQLRMIGTFADRTGGLTLRAMEEIALLARNREIPFERIEDAVRIFKLGIEDNPWGKDSIRVRIKKGEDAVREAVRGQERAVTKTLDILKRAALGLSAAQAATSGTRPRGVLFFAGPTGVGKTELAKKVADLLFGDAHAYLRFDMSEFAADHAADRLTGAPPGYVGYEAGGELTGAVRRKPFQVVLFDEIDKAHPRVMDKFLQIIDEGRLTDGQGVTTYFSECVLIFTSNLGVVVKDERGVPKLTVHPDDPYEELERKIREAITDHFTMAIGRPELLNRFGDNVVVFGFISKQTAEEIFDLQVGNIRRKLQRELGVTLELGGKAREELLRRCTADPLNGGRGVGNKLETNLINPLARYIFDEEIAGHTVLTVDDVRDDRALQRVELSIRTGAAV